MQDTGSKVLADNLYKLPSLTILSIASSKIKNEGLSYFFEKLTSFRNLEKLYINGNLNTNLIFLDKLDDLKIGDKLKIFTK